MEAPAAQRPRSVRSVTSNSSLGSTVSLARRPRITTRARSRTVTGSATPPSDDPQPSLPYIPGPYVQEPQEEDSSALGGPTPPRPPKSPHRLGLPGEILRGSDTTSSLGGRVSTVEGSTFVVDPTQSTAISAAAEGPPSVSKASKQASRLPLLDTTAGYRPPPSAFSRDPALTPGKNVRDSLSTEQSGMSSSLYPPSTSSASVPASPLSPMAPQIDPPSFALEVNEVQEYDGDDVAYRLRLLVQNSYFLPPAHSKPSPADFAPAPQQKKSPRTNAPAFLDIFRVGKSKSKPTTPTGTGPILDNLAPMLRTTSDSITPAFTLPDRQPRSPGQLPLRPPGLQAPPSRGRVVVVREKMLDIATAAKQAEQEVKARGARVDHGRGSQQQHEGTPVSINKNNDNDMDAMDIDPTDAVDAPPPPASYPFAVQASALHGLGVADSVGAGELLAGLLPPTPSQGQNQNQNPTLAKSYDAAEDAWRKQLLHQAVGHSLDNTPDASIEMSMSMSMSMSMILPSLVGAAGAGAERTLSPVGSPEPKASGSLEREKKMNPTPAQIQIQIQRQQAQAHAQAQLLGRKITDSLPLIETPPPQSSQSSHPQSRSPHSHPPRAGSGTPNNPHGAQARKSGESHLSSSSRISMKRSLGLPPSSLVEMMSMPRPTSTLPPRAETPVAPQTPLGPPPRRFVQAPAQMSQTSSSSAEASGASGSNPAAASALDGMPDHLVLRRTVSSPSLAEGSETATARRANTHPHPPFPPATVPITVSMAMTTAATEDSTLNYRLSQVTVTSFNTHDLDPDADASHSQFGSQFGSGTRRSRSLSDPHESDYEYEQYEQHHGRVSLALSAFPAPSTREGSRHRSESGGGSQGGSQTRSRPSLSQSEYSQASLSPTTSAFQEMLNHNHNRNWNHDQDHDRDHDHTHRQRTSSSSAPPSVAPTPEPGSSFRFTNDRRRDEQEQHHQQEQERQQQQRYATYIDVARLEAMSPPPRNSTALAFEALPAPPRSSSLAYNSNSRATNSNPNFNLNSSGSNPNAHASYLPLPRRPHTDAGAPGHGYGQVHIGRSYSQPPVRRSLGSVLGPAPLAVTLEILAPEPTTPPLPPDTSFGDDAAIPGLSGVATAGPSAARSPTSFFDSIQSHPNAMDDLDSSEDEDDDDDEEEDDGLPAHMSLGARHRLPPPPRTSPFNTNASSSFSTSTSLGRPRPRTASVTADTSPRRPMMKHANFSAPYIRGGGIESQGRGQSQTNRSDSGHGSASGHGHGNGSPLAISSRQAVGNVPAKPLQPGLAASSDFFRYAQEHPAAVLSSSAGAGAGSSGVAVVGRGSDQNVKAQESLRRFDGMLQQHIEAEKDTIKRIATTLKQQTAAKSDSLQDLNLPGRR